MARLPRAVKRLVFAVLSTASTVFVLAACARGAPVGAAGDAAAVADGGATASTSTDASAAFPVPREKIEAMLNPTKLPAYQGPTGSIEGTVFVLGPPSPEIPIDARVCPAAIDTCGKQFRSGPPSRADGGRPLGDAVVVAFGYTGYYLPEREEAKHVAITANCAYPSRSITLTYGQRLEVVNDSSTPFAPVLDDGFSPMVFMAPPHRAGDPVKIYPTKAGYTSISDRMQLFVKEDVYVFRHPLHTVSGVDGHYRIDGLPVGKLTLGVRHGGVGAETQTPIEIVANVVSNADVTLTYEPKVAPRGAGTAQSGVIP